ncbi:MAG TPA: multicopper oxidase domain-containing protein, partial [Patescibacteria group bacterium]|nr:multicopper oxidase domain-containing protein [Patescibacteria group bacterium]
MNNKTIFSVVATIIIIAGGVFALQQFNTSQNKTADSRKGTFDASIANLPEAKPSEVVELKNGDTYDMTASIVKKKIGDAEVKMLTYNGSIPGPMIKVPKGAEITINLTNNTDVETALHSHGVRLANAFDGVPDVTQEPIGIGETFTYKIKFPDEGLYWYHPHVREDYAQELGLYGNYLVASPDSNYLSPVNREVSLMLDDILIENGAIVPFSKESANYALMGRFGNVMLASGETDYSLDVKKGEVVRLFLTNTANTRIFKFSIPGAQMKLVGGDSGKYEKEAFVDSVVLAPSERTIVDALFKESGEYP